MKSGKCLSLLGLLLASSAAMAGPITSGSTLEFQGQATDPESGLNTTKVFFHADLKGVQFSSASDLSLTGALNNITLHCGNHQEAMNLKQSLENGAQVTTAHYNAFSGGDSMYYSSNCADLKVTPLALESNKIYGSSAGVKQENDVQLTAPQDGVYDSDSKTCHSEASVAQ